MKLLKSRQGLTLIEILLVIVILAILASLIIVALNPAQNVSDANDAVIEHEMNQIARGIQQWTIDSIANTGTIPTELSALDGVGATTLSDTGADICAALVTQYLAELPAAPGFTDASPTDCAGVYDVGYTITFDIDPTTNAGLFTISDPVTGAATEQTKL